MAQHTPGPWTVFSPGDEAWPGIEAPEVGTSIAVFENKESEYAGIQGRNREEALANARLIAAAPDMLAALEALTAWAAMMGGWGAPCWEQASEAILKATEQAE